MQSNNKSLITKQLQHQSECIENPTGELFDGSHRCPGLLSWASGLREAALSSGADQQCISSALFLGVEREERKGGLGGKMPRTWQGCFSAAVFLTDLA